MVLVRPDHVADVPPAIRLCHRAGSPEPGRLQQDLGAGAKEEIVVAGRAPVLPDRIGDVGADVVLHLAGQDLDCSPSGPTTRSGVVSMPVSADSQA